MVCELATRIGGASTVCSRPVASTTFSFRVGFFMISGFLRAGAHIGMSCSRRPCFFGASLSVSFANVSGPLALVLLIGILAHYVPKKWYDWSLTLYVRAPFYAQAGALTLLVLGLQNVVQSGAAPFIYSKF